MFPTSIAVQWRGHLFIIKTNGCQIRGLKIQQKIIKLNGI